MDMLRCEITQVPLRPEEATRCEVCGKIIRSDLAVTHRGIRMCPECYRRAVRREGRRNIVVEAAVARL